MANITRSDPFRGVARFEPFRELEGFPAWSRVRRLFDDLPDEPATIRIDVTEDEKCYVVKAEIPGVKKEDISVEVEGNQVSIAAEVRRETEQKKGEVVHSERYFGRQFRSFSLGRDIDRKKVQAKYAEGVLELTLPKNGAPVAEKIAIL